MSKSDSSCVLVSNARATLFALALSAAPCAAADATFLVEQRNAHPPVHGLVADVERQLPDDTVLHRISVAGGKLHLQGETPDVAALVLALQRSATVTQPELQGAVAPSARTGKDMFLLQTRVKTGAQYQASIAPPTYLPDADFGIASVRLLERVKQTVAAHARDPDSCQLVLAQPYRSAQAEPRERVTVKVRLRCTEEELAPILAALESDAPTVFVEDFQRWLQVGFRPGSQEPNEFLDIRFDAYGYLDRAPAPQ